MHGVTEMRARRKSILVGNAKSLFIFLAEVFPRPASRVQTRKKTLVAMDVHESAIWDTFLRPGRGGVTRVCLQCPQPRKDIWFQRGEGSHTSIFHLVWQTPSLPRPFTSMHMRSWLCYSRVNWLCGVPLEPEHKLDYVSLERRGHVARQVRLLAREHADHLAGTWKGENGTLEFER